MPAEMDRSRIAPLHEQIVKPRLPESLAYEGIEHDLLDRFLREHHRMAKLPVVRAGAELYGLPRQRPVPRIVVIADRQAAFVVAPAIDILRFRPCAEVDRLLRGLREVDVPPQPCAPPIGRHVRAGYVEHDGVGSGMDRLRIELPCVRPVVHPARRPSAAVERLESAVGEVFRIQCRCGKRKRQCAASVHRLPFQSASDTFSATTRNPLPAFVVRLHDTRDALRSLSAPVEIDPPRSTRW